MKHVSFSSRVDASADEVFRWHERPAALRRLIPPWLNVEVVSNDGVEPGSKVRLRFHRGMVSFKWVAEHTELVPNDHFVDEQRRGPFRNWRHVHRIAPDDEGSRLQDDVEYSLPISLLSEPVVGSIVQKHLARHFAYRHRTVNNDLRLHHRYTSPSALRIAVSGATGLIGSQLVDFFEAGGHQVYRFVRSVPENPDIEIHWNHREDILEKEKLEGLDAVIHLAGETVLSPRWSQQKKMEIIGSRVGGTEHLAKSLATLNDPPAAFLSASAIGYYGNRDKERLDENSLPGDDSFLSALCQDWEKATWWAADAGIRTVQMRIGIVLSPFGGVLKSLLIPFRWGLGGRYGGRHQYLSWVGLNDVLGAVYHVLSDSEFWGPVNITSPEPVTMTHFARTLGRVLSRPVYAHMPPWLVRLLLGEVADDAALMSVRALPARLASGGYEFLYPNLEDMLRHVLGRTLEPFTSNTVSGLRPAVRTRLDANS